MVVMYVRKFVKPQSILCVSSKRGILFCYYYIIYSTQNFGFFKLGSLKMWTLNSISLICVTFVYNFILNKLCAKKEIQIHKIKMRVYC